MSKYLNPETQGHEPRPKPVKKQRPAVKNMLCPRDGHYCEQPNCENCMFETVGSGGVV